MSNDRQRQDLEGALVQHRRQLREIAHATVGTFDYRRRNVPISPASTAVSYRHLVAVDKALSCLPPLTRTAFMLYRSNGLTRHQIAEQLRVSPTLVNVMIEEALAALKQCRAVFTAE